jgi:hypothetical protein
MTADLAARLEAATEGSRELSNEVLRVCGWELTMPATSERVVWLEPTPSAHGYTLYAGLMHEEGEQPDPTRDLNAIFTLVDQSDWPSYVLSSPGYDNGRLINKVRADLHHLLSSGGGPKVKAFAATPALALSAALVKAAA